MTPTGGGVMNFYRFDTENRGIGSDRKEGGFRGTRMTIDEFQLRGPH